VFFESLRQELTQTFETNTPSRIEFQIASIENTNPGFAPRKFKSTFCGKHLGNSGRLGPLIPIEIWSLMSAGIGCTTHFKNSAWDPMLQDAGHDSNDEAAQGMKSGSAGDPTVV